MFTGMLEKIRNNRVRLGLVIVVSTQTIYILQFIVPLMELFRITIDTILLYIDQSQVSVADIILLQTAVEKTLLLDRIRYWYAGHRMSVDLNRLFCIGGAVGQSQRSVLEQLGFRHIVIIKNYQQP
jgi:hypothetical protein